MSVVEKTLSNNEQLEVVCANLPSTSKIAGDYGQPVREEFSFCNDVGDSTHEFEICAVSKQAGLHPKEILPSLVWRLALALLKDEKDIESCYNTCTFFRNVVWEKRDREIVYPKVFRYLAKRYYNSKANQMTDLWKCRLVCKKWNKGIENIFRNSSSNQFRMDYQKHDNINIVLGKKWGIDVFRNETDVSKFLDKFETTHYDFERQMLKKCPFLGETVRVVYSYNEEGILAFSEGLMKMMKRFGVGIKYLRFDCYNSEILGSKNIYKVLIDMIGLMPNLKGISVKKGYGREVLEQESAQLPQLPNLEMISMYDIPGSWCNNLINSNMLITHLELFEIDFDGNCTIFNKHLPNLVELRMDIDSIQTFENFENYGSGMRLQNLSILFSRGVPFVQWSRVFNAVQSKCDVDRCTELYLKMPNAETYTERKLVLEESLSYRLQLHNIQKINFNSGQCQFFVDFLLESKDTLLEIQVTEPFQPETLFDEIMNRQLIKFYGYENKLEESNIGNVFRQLKKMQVNNEKFSIETGRVVKV